MLYRKISKIYKLGNHKIYICLIIHNLTFKGLFDCSQNYAEVRNHLECNVRRECVGGEDEPEPCPFTSPLCPSDTLFLQVSHVTVVPM